MVLQSRCKDDSIIEIGIDEAGRGSFWGPITAGAVIIPPESEWTDEQRLLLLQLRDSKKISPKKRENLYNKLKECIPLLAIGMVEAHEINKYGIQWANMEAFRRAIQNLNYENVNSCRLIIDGTLAIDDWKGEHIQEIIIEGDDKYIAIAAASILATVGHDKWIEEYCDNNTECNDRYDLKKSKGYGTAKHRAGILTWGEHSEHRKLFLRKLYAGTATAGDSTIESKEVS